MNHEPRVAWDARCILGEGPVWLEEEQSLYFVDIKAPALHAFTPESGARRTWPMPERLGWVIPRANGRGWLAGFQSGVALLELGAAPRIEWLHRLHQPGSPVRLNDAKADAAGRVWFGSMNDEDPSRQDGKLYRLATDGTLTVVDEGYCIANGPALSRDGRTLYHTCSFRGNIYAYSLDATGEAGESHIWRRFQEGEGAPDGMSVDADGCLWVAQWGAARVTRFDPDGRPLASLSFPATQVSSVAFGGADCRDLYATSARMDLSAEALAREPLAGALFVVEGAGQGVPPARFGG